MYKEMQLKSAPWEILGVEEFRLALMLEGRGKCEFLGLVTAESGS